MVIYLCSIIYIYQLKEFKIKKLILIALLAAFSIPTYVNATEKPTAGIPKKIGGWYPVFFDGYNTKKINQIVASINKGDVSKISISYDQNKTLALKIESGITKKTKFKIDLIENHPKDDKLVQYNHTQVVVTIWNK